MEDLPEEMLVFSSDFPHFEGFTAPTDHYRKLLADLPRQQVDRFMGGTIDAAFKRMGDALL